MGSENMGNASAATLLNERFHWLLLRFLHMHYTCEELIQTPGPTLQQESELLGELIKAQISGSHPPLTGRRSAAESKNLYV